MTNVQSLIDKLTDVDIRSKMGVLSRVTQELNVNINDIYKIPKTDATNKVISIIEKNFKLAVDKFCDGIPAFVFMIETMNSKLSHVLSQMKLAPVVSEKK